MRNFPIEVILSWPPPNYENPVTRGPELIWVNAFFISIVGIAVALRLYVRIFMLRFGWDDVFIILATLSAIGMTACAIVAYEHFGWDRHIWDTPLSKLNPALKLAWWTKLVYSTAACFTRMSLLLFYYRLTKGTSMKWFRWCIHFSVFVSILTGTSLVLLVIFQCKPIRAFWTYPPIPGQKCLDEGYKTLGCGIANTIADMLVVILPIPLISKLNLPLRRRVGAILLVSLGFIVCIAGTVRAYFTWLSLIKSYDETWECYGMYISAAVEIDLGVICACAPALRLVMIKIVSPRLEQFARSWSSKQSLFGSSRLGYTKRSHTTSETSSRVLKSVSSYDTHGLPDFEMLPNKPTTRHRDDLLREKGFIITSGVSRGKPLPELRDEKIAPVAHDDGVDYLWDEPWTGPNGPRPRTLSAALSPEEDLNDTTSLSQRYEVAVPVKIIARTQSTSRAATTSNGKPAGFGINIMEQKGVGVLPDSSTIPDTTSSKAQSIPSINATRGSDEITLPIQGFHLSNTLSPETPKKRSNAMQIPARVLKASRSPLFDFDFPFNDGKKPQASKRHQKKTSTDSHGDGNRRLSFLEEPSRETVLTPSRLPTPTREYVRQQHADLWQAVSGGDRIRILNRRERDESVGRS